jgi:hypothetical protein
MSYIGRYNKFIESCKGQDIVQPYEVHHIVPRSMGGTNEPSNLIKLTLRQHYIAHWMLWKAYGGKMAHAFHFMSLCGKYKKLNSRSYEKLRMQALEIFGGEKNPWYGKKHLKKSKEKQSIKRKQYMSNPEARENLRKHRANQVISKESYEKASKKHKQLKWMNNGIIGCRVCPEDVEQKIKDGFSFGRLNLYINDEYRLKRSLSAKQYWSGVKA